MRQLYRAGPMHKLVAHEKGIRELWRILANDFMTCLSPPALSIYMIDLPPRAKGQTLMT
jgi:hypothetical protein